MKIKRVYEVNFDDGFTEKEYCLSAARHWVNKKRDDAKVVSIISTYIDKNGIQKRNYVKF